MTKHKRLRLLYTILIILVALVPVVFVFSKYDIIGQYLELDPTHKKVWFGIFIAVILFIGFFKKIFLLLREMEFSVIKAIVNGIVYMFPTSLLLVILIGLTYIIKDLILVLELVFITNAVIFFILMPLWQYENEKIKDERQIKNVRSALK